MSDRWVDEYRLVLAVEVNDLIAGGLGWQPYGGPVVSDGGRLVQAMVRYEKEG